MSSGPGATPRRCPRCARPVPERAAYCPFDGFRLAGVSTFRRGVLTHETGSSGAVLGGRYRIDAYVDRGATSRVYMAEDLQTKRTVAVKIFAPSVALGERMRARFLRGAHAIMAVRHPNVVEVLDTGVSSLGAPYIVLEALAGRTLGARIGYEGRLDEPTALRFSMEAAAGLCAAHAVGVVHRDLKPDNLFVVRAADGAEHVKVIDFGMAKVERSSSSSSHGLVMGTMQYMAPEQIVGDRVDARTDVYGLGVVMFRLFTGHLPFDVAERRDPELGGDLQVAGKEVLGHQLFSAAPPPRWLADDLDPRVENVMLCAMRKRPDNRYPDMTALLEDLVRIKGGGRPMGQPLAVEPDLYEPSTELGRRAARHLAAELGLKGRGRP